MQNLISRLLPIMLIGIMVPSFIEVDITLPGFPEMAGFFKSTEASIQFTLIMNFLGLCILTLVYGPLSDAIGRKKVLVIGCGLFFLGSIGCASVNTLFELYVCRFLQGVGCSAIWVVGFIVCSDRYKDDESVQVFGVLNSAISGSLVIAPMIGAFVVAAYHWRGTFNVVVALSGISLLLAMMFLPETNKSMKSFSFKAVLVEYRQLSCSWRFLAYALTPSILLAALIAFLSSVPFLYLDQLKMSYSTFALYQALPGATLAVVGYYSGKIHQKIGASNCILLSTLISFTGCILFFTTSQLMPNSPQGFSLSMIAVCIGSALQFSMVFSKSLELFPALRGSASSLIIFFRLILFSVAVGLASHYYTGKLFDSSLVVIAFTMVGLALSQYIRYDLKIASKKLTLLEQPT